MSDDSTEVHKGEQELNPSRGDRFDEMAAAWFGKLPSLASETYARRYLARFLRDAVEAERQRMAATFQESLVGKTCEGCGQPAAGSYCWPHLAGTESYRLQPLCEACARVAGSCAKSPRAQQGTWFPLADLAKLGR